MDDKHLNIRVIIRWQIQIRSAALINRTKVAGHTMFLGRGTERILISLERLDVKK